METMLKRACMEFGVPLIGLRGISDGATALHYFDDWTQYLHIIDEKLAAVADAVEQALTSGGIG